MVDERNQLPLGRPRLTVAIDIASRAVTGFYLTMEAPSAVSVAMALRHAIFSKDNWLAERRICQTAFKQDPRSASKRDPLPFDISFYSADERYSDKGRPFGTFDGLAERVSSGSPQLPEWAFCFDPAAKRLNDPFVRIEVAGEELLFEKVKYDTNEAFGIERDKDGIYFLDRIRIDAHRA